MPDAWESLGTVVEDPWAKLGKEVGKAEPAKEEASTHTVGRLRVAEAEQDVSYETQLKGGEELSDQEKETYLGGGGKGGTISGAVRSGIKGAQTVFPAMMAAGTAKVTQFIDALAHIERAVSTNPIKAQGPAAEARAIRDIWAGTTAELVKEREEIPKSFPQQAMAEAKPGDRWGVFKQFPVQTVASVVLESAPPSIVGATAGTVVGGPGVGTAVGAGLASGAMEFSNTFLSEAAKAGYNPADATEFSLFLDSRHFDDAVGTAIARSAIIGTTDAATAGVAGEFIGPALRQGLKKVLPATLAEIGLQAGGGAGGEFLAQAATKKKGEAFDWFDIGMEAIAEIFTGPSEAFSNIRESLSIAAARANVAGAPATAKAVREQGGEEIEPNPPKPATAPQAPPAPKIPEMLVKSQEAAKERIAENKLTIKALEEVIRSRKQREQPYGDFVKTVQELRVAIADDEEFLGFKVEEPKAKPAAKPAAKQAELGVKVEPKAATPGKPVELAVAGKPTPEEEAKFDYLGSRGKLKILSESRSGDAFLVRYLKDEPTSTPIEVPKTDILRIPKRATRTPAAAPTTAQAVLTLPEGQKAPTVTPAPATPVPAPAPVAETPSPEDIAEREAIDAGVSENKAAGLPSDVVIEDNPKGPDDDDYVPFSSQRIAYPDSQGRIRINRPVFREWIGTVPEKQRKKAVATLLRHEGIHAVARKVVSDDELAAIYNGLTAPEKALLQKAYTGEFRGAKKHGFNATQMGHEHVRRAMERLMGGPVSERVGTTGFERITQPVIDIIERVIAYVRKTFGKDKAISDILDRIQEGVDRNVESKEEPEAFYRRKTKPSGEGQAEMGLPVAGAPAEREERITAEQAKLQTGFAPPPLNSIQISSLADEAITEDDDFGKFSARMRRNYDLSAGELHEVWEDAVWRQAEHELAQVPQRSEVEFRPSIKEQLLKEASELDARADTLASRMGGAEIGAQQEIGLPRSESEEQLYRQAKHLRGEAETVRKRAETASDEPVKVPAPRDYSREYRPGEIRAENRIATKALRLIDQARASAPPALRRSSIEPEDVRVGDPEAFIDFDEDDNVQASDLVRDAGLDRTTRIRKLVSEGVAKTIRKRRPTEAETKRVTALKNVNTGEVQLVSTYTNRQQQEGRTVDVVQVYDPRFSHKAERPSVPYDQLRKEAPEWRPIASILLDEPVKNFRQRFKTQDEFEATLAERVRTEYGAAQRQAAAPVAEGKDEGTPRLRRSGSLTEQESNSLFDTLVDEVGTVESREDIDDLVTGLKDRAQSNALTARDWNAINALSRISDAIEREFPSYNENQVIENVKDEIYQIARRSRTSDRFTQIAMGQFAREAPAAPVIRKAPAKPERASPYRSIAEQRRATLEQGLEQSRYEFAGEQERARYEETLKRGAALAPGARESKQEERLRKKEAAAQKRAYVASLRNLTAAELRRQKEQAKAAKAQTAANIEAQESAEEAAEYQRTLAESAILSPSFYRNTFQQTTDPDVNAPQAFLRMPNPRPAIGAARSGLNTALFNPLRLGSEWMVDKMRRIGERLPPNERAIVEDITGKFNQIISKSWAYQGDMNARFGDDIMALAGRIDSPTWLNQVQVIERRGTAIRNAKEAIEGRLQAPTRRSQEYVAAGQEANILIGEMLEPVAPGFIANGGMSSNWTPLMFDIVMSFSDPINNRDSLREKVIRGNARANSVTPAEVRRVFDRMRTQLSEPGSNDARVAAIAQDFVRQYPRVVTDVWVPSGIPGLGHWESVIHAGFHDYFHHGIRKAASIRAFRETYPVDSGELEEDNRQLRAVLPRYGGLIDSTFRVLQGQPSESSLGQQAIFSIETGLREFGMRLGPIRAFNELVSPLFRSLMLTRQIALQPAELVSGANSAFWGYDRGFRDAFVRYTDEYGSLEAAGLLDRMMYNDSFDPRAPARSIGRIASNLVRRVAVENVVNEMQEAQNAMGALITARAVIDAAAGGPQLSPRRQLHLRKAFEYMGFTRDEVDQMMAGDVELLEQMQRKAASWLSAGHKHAGERSRLLAARLFQKAFWFWDYPMARLNQLIKITDTMLKDMEAGRWREAATDAEMMARFGFSAIAQGYIQMGLLTLFGTGLYGLSVKLKELLDEPIAFTLDAFRAAVGGPVQQLTEGYEDRGLRGVKDNILKMMTPTPYSITADLTAAAKGWGKYRDIPLNERMARFAAGKTPGWEALRSGIAMEVFAKATDNDGLLNDAKFKTSLKAFYQWRRKNYGGTETDSYLKEDVKKQFNRGMRKAKDGLMKNDYERFEEGLKEAGAGRAEIIAQEEKRSTKTVRERVRESLARSIETQNILKIETAANTYRPMKPSEIEALKKHIGEDSVDRLMMFDFMLKNVAKRIR